MSRIGPIVMEVKGDIYPAAARIQAIIWEGGTTSGDIAELECPVTQIVLWPGRTNSSFTYLGISFGDTGLHAPHGFRVKTLNSGRLLVYLREN